MRNFFNMNYVMQPLQNIPGAAGTAQQSDVIIPPGYGTQPDFMSQMADTLSEGFLQYSAQQRAQKQLAEQVKGLESFRPIMQATGANDEQINGLLRAGMTPKEIAHFFLTQEAGRAMKNYEYGHEEYTHQRDLSETAFTPDQMSIIDSYKEGKMSLSDAMRQSNLSAKQLKSAISESSAGEELRQKPLDTLKKSLELQDLPGKLRQESETRQQRIKELKQRIAMAPTKEAREQASADLARERFEFEKSKLPSTKGLSIELQQQANNLKGLGSSQAMYAQAAKAGLKVRKPNMAPTDVAGFKTGKDESKDSYYKDVILPALQNKQLELRGSSTGAPTYNFPKTPYGVAAPKIAVAFGIDPNIFGRLINQESGWNNNARNGVGAIGFGQLMPDTARSLKVNPNNPYENLSGSARYLRGLLDQFGGDYSLALAAYNAGPNAVRKYGGIPPYRETQAYVRAILGTNDMRPVARPAQQAPSGQQRKSLDEVL